MTLDHGIIRNFSSVNADAGEIVKELAKVVRYAMHQDTKGRKFVKEFSIDGDYSEKSETAKMAVLKYCAKAAGIKSINSKADVINAFENPTFSSIFNSIMVDTLQSVILKVKPEQLFRLAIVSEVEVGDSDTFEIEPKGLPIAQKTSYTSNVTFLDSYAVSPITIKPQPYSMGITLDYIRILSKTYDLGSELARVALGMLFAQLKLVVSLIYAVANVNGTPLYQANFTGANYVQMISDLKMLNGGAEVTAYGTLPAFNAIGAIATTNYGFMSQDEMIREGFLGRAYGVDNVVIDQITDLSSPFTTANAATLRTVPNDRILLLSSVADKPVKLVRENFVHVKTKDPLDGSQYRKNYEYFMSFNAAIATQAHYGIQGTNS